MNRHKKRNNNLICIDVEGEKQYYTSASRAGKVLGLANCSVNWAIVHENTLVNNDGKKVRISMIDGSDVPYKYINNED